MNDYKNTKTKCWADAWFQPFNELDGDLEMHLTISIGKQIKDNIEWFDLMIRSFKQRR